MDNQSDNNLINKTVNKPVNKPVNNLKKETPQKSNAWRNVGIFVIVVLVLLFFLFVINRIKIMRDEAEAKRLKDLAGAVLKR